jgi:hypothetical protein
VFGLSCGPDVLPPVIATPPQADKLAAIRRRQASAKGGASRRFLSNDALHIHPSTARTPIHAAEKGRRGRLRCEDTGREPEECGVVEMESVTGTVLLPGVTGADGEKFAEAIGGKFDAVNVTGFVKLPLEGATVKLKLAGCPAETDVEVDVAVTM